MLGLTRKQIALFIVFALAGPIMLPGGLCFGNVPTAANIFSNAPLMVMTHEQFESWFSQNMTIPAEDPNIHPVSLIQGQVRKSSTRLSPGDSISVNVSGLPEFSREKVMIYTDGYIHLPYVGEIKVTDMSAGELETLLREEYKHYIIDPHVSVIVTNRRPPSTYVLGAVAKPGTYVQLPLEGGLPDTRSSVLHTNFKLSTALENAGGVSEFGDVRNVHVFNKESGMHRVVNLMDLIVFGQIDNDVVLNPDDVIYIPRIDSQNPMEASMLNLMAHSTIGKKTFPVKIHGLVETPNLYDLKPEEMTLHTVIAKAGGLLKSAQAEKIIIARTSPDGSLVKLMVDSSEKDIMLHPNDIVLVDNTTGLSKLDTMLTVIARIFQPSVQSAFVYRNLR